MTIKVVTKLRFADNKDLNSFNSLLSYLKTDMRTFVNIAVRREVERVVQEYDAKAKAFKEKQAEGAIDGQPRVIQSEGSHTAEPSPGPTNVDTSVLANEGNAQPDSGPSNAEG